jgi:hypothetical protein
VSLVDGVEATGAALAEGGGTDVPFDLPHAASSTAAATISVPAA